MSLFNMTCKTIQLPLLTPLPPQRVSSSHRNLLRGNPFEGNLRPHSPRTDQLKTHRLSLPNFEVRDYRYNIVHRALFRNTLCAIPTGMGKTFIASTVMLNFYRWSRCGKVIFMAPTRPLVAQQIQACSRNSCGIPSRDAAILLDKSRKNRIEIWKEKRVFFYSSGGGERFEAWCTGS